MRSTGVERNSTLSHMRNIENWLTEYGASHQHPLNERLHWVCVPLIMLSLLGLLWLVPFPAGLPPWMNWASVLVAGAMSYYLWLSPRLASGMLAVSLLMLALLHWASTALPLFWLCLVVFVVAWIGQLYGHHVEGARPSFFKDVQFLLIGPLWLLAFVYRRLGWRY